MEWTHPLLRDHELQKDWIEPWKKWRIIHIPNCLTLEEVIEAYKRAGWREANYLPGRGESMINEVDGLGQLSGRGFVALK